MFEKEFNLKIAECLKNIRKEKGLSVYKVAKEINRSVDSLYAYEEGSRTIPLAAIYDLSNLYNVSIDDLIKNSVTKERKKAVSFDLYKDNKKERIVIDSENDDVLFYEVDEWTYKYFVKCIDFTLNKEVLVLVDKKVFPAVISLDEKSGVYTLFDITTNTATNYKNKKFKDSVVVLGDYAGTISKQLKIVNFL